MDDKDGLTAWEAIERLFPEPDPEPESEPRNSTAVKSDLGLWSGGTTWVDAEYDERLGGALRAGIALPGAAERCGDFQDLLRQNSWYARGYPVPSAKPERIRPGLWDILKIDLDSNTASSRGLEYEGLRFFKAKPEAKKTKKAENECREWLVGVMEAERTQTEGQLHGEAEERLPGLSAKAFKRAWKFAKAQPTTHPSWQTRGPIPSL